MNPVTKIIHGKIGTKMGTYLIYIQEGDDVSTLFPMRITNMFLNKLINHKVLRRIQENNNIIDCGPRPYVAKIRFHLRLSLIKNKK